MFLLACAAGYPAHAREWFGALRRIDATDALTLPRDESDSPAWEQFRLMFEALAGSNQLKLTKSSLCEWIDNVEQFAF